MTFIATQSFRLIVLCVAEADTKSQCGLTRANMTTGLMAHATGRNILIAGLRARCMTAEAGCMSVEARGNRNSNAAARGAMATGTANIAHSHVTPVIEFHIEAL
jgi:hypothetical protein